jgi:hypothetical protein
LARTPQVADLAKPPRDTTARRPIEAVMAYRRPGTSGINGPVACPLADGIRFARAARRNWEVPPPRGLTGRVGLQRRRRLDAGHMAPVISSVAAEGKAAASQHVSATHACELCSKVAKRKL